MRSSTAVNINRLSPARQRGVSAALVFCWGIVVLASSPAFASHLPQLRQTELRIIAPYPSKAQASPTGTAALSPKQALGAEIDADSEKLVQLAEELKAELAKSGKDTLPLPVIKKATELEKLAKSLKDRLKRESAM